MVFKPSASTHRTLLFFDIDWPDVQSALGGLDGLRLYGIHFPDVPLRNIRVRK